jgi:hypothetical protein
MDARTEQLERSRLLELGEGISSERLRGATLSQT